MNFYKKIIPILLIAALIVFASCKRTEIRDVSYNPQHLYLPAAAAADGPGGQYGAYNITSLATAGQGFRYLIKPAERKLQIPLAVLRAGAVLEGELNVTISELPDSIDKSIDAGPLMNTGTEKLPGDKYAVDKSVKITSGQSLGHFTMDVDLDYLLSNSTRKFAIAISVSSATVSVFSKYSTLVILIDPKFLIPEPNFDYVVDAAAKSVTFNNTTTNGLSYLWDFGDGTPASTAKSLTHVYQVPGIYSVKLTVEGALGAENKATVTKLIQIL